MVLIYLFHHQPDNLDTGSYGLQVLFFYTGWPGSVHDAHVFYRKANAGQLLSDTTKTISGVSVPVFVIGDSAYPMLPWLMKPYSQPSVDSAEKCTFNYRISWGHIVVEMPLDV